MAGLLILPGDDNAASFCDDGSLDGRLTGRKKVSIEAQVLRHLSLEWFHRLLSLFPDIPGDLKSNSVVTRFYSLPNSTQLAIWKGMSRVRIHIDERQLETNLRPTVKLRLAALRMLFDWLVVGQVMASNAASRDAGKDGIHIEDLDKAVKECLK